MERDGDGENLNFRAWWRVCGVGVGAGGAGVGAGGAGAGGAGAGGAGAGGSGVARLGGWEVARLQV